MNDPAEIGGHDFTEDKLRRPNVFIMDVTKYIIGIDAVIKDINHFP